MKLLLSSLAVLSTAAASSKPKNHPEQYTNDTYGVQAIREYFYAGGQYVNYTLVRN